MMTVWYNPSYLSKYCLLSVQQTHRLQFLNIWGGSQTHSSSRAVGSTWATPAPLPVSVGSNYRDKCAELVEIPVRPFQYRDPSELATESNRQHVFHSGPSTSTRTTTNSPKTLRPYPNPTTTVLLAIRTLSSGRTRNRTSACLSPHVTRTNLLLAPSYWPTPTPYLTYRHTTSLSELYWLGTAVIAILARSSKQADIYRYPLPSASQGKELSFSVLKRARPYWYSGAFSLPTTVLSCGVCGNKFQGHISPWSPETWWS